MTDTPPHTALAIERVKEIANGANKITEAELQSLCDLAIKALTPPPPGQYDELCRRLSRRSQTHNTGRAVGAGDGATHAMGYYDAYCAKDDAEAAAAITDLQQQVRDARAELSKALEPVSDVDAMALANINGHCDAAKSESHKTGWLDALEEAADIIRKYAVTESADGQSLRERYDGDIHAMHYVTAILALKDKQPADACSEITAIFKDLAAKQQPLDPIVARAINENIEGLYEP